MSRSQLRFGAGERGVPVALFPDADLLGEALCPGHAHYSCRRYGRREILEQSRRVILVMTGAKKHAAGSHLRRCADFTPDWPASFIYRCQNPAIFVDRFASPAA